MLQNLKLSEQRHDIIEMEINPCPHVKDSSEISGSLRIIYKITQLLCVSVAYNMWINFVFRCESHFQDISLLENVPLSQFQVS